MVGLDRATRTNLVSRPDGQVEAAMTIVPVRS